MADVEVLKAVNIVVRGPYPALSHVADNHAREAARKRGLRPVRVIPRGLAGTPKDGQVDYHYRLLVRPAEPA